MADPVPDAPIRVDSVDTLRGLVITLMIFVNDVAGAPHAPSWLKHVSAEADAMTLPDIVFPAFLFIAGVSIPLAIERALASGHTRRQVLGKVFGRTLALLVMGFVMVNLEEYSPWPRGLWGVLAYLAMFAAFAFVPETSGSARTRLARVRWVGAAALVVLVLVYRTADGRAIVLGPWFHATDEVWLRHSWWGILGLIGWAYLMASLVYLMARRRREWLFGAVACLMLLYVAAAANLPGQLAGRSWLQWATPVLGAVGAGLGWINTHVSVGSVLGSMSAVVVAGSCLGSILTARSEVRTPVERVRWALAFAAGLGVAGVLLDAPYGINKIRATPAWCLYCSALTAIGWAGLYWLIDIRGVRGWARLVRPAGANPLLAYVLHPFLYYVVGLAGGAVSSVFFFYKSPELPALVAIIGSLLMAGLIVQATGWIARAGFRLKV